MRAPQHTAEQYQNCLVFKVPNLSKSSETEVEQEIIVKNTTEWHEQSHE